MSFHKKGNIKQVLSGWQALVLIVSVIATALVVNYLLKKAARDEAAVTAAGIRSCEKWERQYAVVPWNKFPPDSRLGRALRVGRGEKWVIRLHSTELSGWVVLDPTIRNWTRPTNTAHMLFTDSLEITDTPEKEVERGNRNTFRAWGEGCMLVEVSG